MTLTDIGILLIGGAAIVIGLTQKTFYYGGLHGTASKRRAPTSYGRLMFIGVGSLFVLFELVHIFLELMRLFLDRT